MRSKYLLIVFTICCSSLIVNCLPAKYFTWGMARALGMGNAFTAVADDASALLWNPAGLAQFTEKEVSVSSSLATKELTQLLISYITPPTETELAGGFFYLRVHNTAAGGIDRLDEALCYTITQPIDPRTAFGLTFKYRKARDTRGETTVTGSEFGFDFGGLYRVSRKITLGFNIQDFTKPTVATIKDETIFNAGVLLRISPRIKIAADAYNLTDERSADDPNLKREYRVGGEFRIMGNVFLRAGLSDEYPTFGAGIKRERYGVDIGYLDGKEVFEDFYVIDVKAKF